MPITLDIAELSNGVRLPYAEQGAPDGIPLILLHGITDSWRSFEPVLPHLPGRLHVHAVTARGHGDASRPGSYALADMVDDVARFLDAAGLGSAIVAGHSMGSVVATRFAIDHPDRTDGLVVMGGAAAFGRLGMEGLRDELTALRDPLDRDYLRGFQESTLARPIPPAFLDVAVEESAKLSRATFLDALVEVCMTDFSGDLGRIAAPTLVVWGDRDVICTREEQDALIGAIPHARLSVHEGGGHAMHWEDPERVAREITGFAEEVAGR
jgi:pimeloyl-ACP methyl ester carboxylesterase